MSWKDILKNEGLKEEFEYAERALEKAKEKADSRQYTSETRKTIDAILRKLDEEFAGLQKIIEEGKDVYFEYFEETMDRLDYFINRQHPQTIREDEFHFFQ